MTPSRAERAGLKRGAVRAEARAAGFGRSTESASEQAGWHREVPAAIWQSTGRMTGETSMGHAVIDDIARDRGTGS